MNEWEEERARGRASLARTLSDLYRRFQEDAAARYQDLGWQGLGLAHVQFLAEVQSRGTRLTELAESLGTTKQYAGKMAKDAALHGLVELTGDPQDRRAVLVIPTDRGQSFFTQACAVRHELENNFEARLGAERYQAFVDSLALLAMP